MSLLTPYRVLDLTDERGNYAGLLLAQLGAEVIAIEPPGGQRARYVGPFVPPKLAEAIPLGEQSLTHWMYNRGKKSVVLDLEHSHEDRLEFRRLAAGADMLIESQSPGYLEGIGISVTDLGNQALIVVSISPFGQDGPKSTYASSDLTVVAAGMYMALTGDDDRAPLRSSLPQTFHHASIDAVGAALVALWERQRSGLGQHIDVSAQASILLATSAYVLTSAFGAPESKRVTGGFMVPPFNVRSVWQCKDGHVTLFFLFGPVLGPFVARLMGWIYEEDGCSRELLDIDWPAFGADVAKGTKSVEEYEQAKEVIAAFLQRKTKNELLRAALERRLLIAPLLTVAEVLQDEHLESRSYFEHVDTLAGELAFPGAVAKFSHTPLLALGRAPMLGEHTSEIRNEATRKVVAQPSADSQSSRALSGLKVLDYMWVVAGPAASRVFADYGATIVRVESECRPDAARFSTPLLHNESGRDNCGMFLDFNAGKLSLALNMNKPESRAVVADLVRWADVVCDSFSPGVMQRWGLSYDELRDMNPRVIVLSSSLMGQTGPYSGLAGFGTMAGAVSGLTDLCGWPGRAPCGPYGAYTDYVAPRIAVLAVMAALEYRRRTGKGQYIDLSQSESTLPLLGPAFLDYALSGEILKPFGNRDPQMAPHGVFRSAPRVNASTGAIDDDRWVAIACEHDDHWRSLSDELGRPDLERLTTAERLTRVDEIEGLMENWTIRFDESEVEARLQRRSIPTHAVQNSAECADDPQLRHRGHFVTNEHSVVGPVPNEASRFIFSRTEAGPYRAAPALGEHSQEVLSDLLGYSNDRIEGLHAAGVLE